MALSVFPERMNKLDPEDPARSLTTVEAYIQYICERVEFTLGNNYKTINGMGTTAEGFALLLAGLSNKLDELTSKVNTMQGNVTGLQSTVESLQTSVAAAAGAAAAAQQAAETNAAAIQGLDERVTRLENPSEGGES